MVPGLMMEMRETFLSPACIRTTGIPSSLAYSINVLNYFCLLCVVSILN
jgi:hypothetical protein